MLEPTSRGHDTELLCHGKLCGYSELVSILLYYLLLMLRRQRDQKQISTRINLIRLRGGQKRWNAEVGLELLEGNFTFFFLEAPRFLLDCLKERQTYVSGSRQNLFRVISLLASL